MRFLALLLALCVLAGCSVVQPKYNEVHEDVFGCPPVDQQTEPCEKVPNMEQILDLPKCDDPQPVYPGPRCFEDITLPGDSLYLWLKTL